MRTPGWMFTLSISIGCATPAEGPVERPSSSIPPESSSLAPPSGGLDRLHACEAQAPDFEGSADYTVSLSASGKVASVTAMASAVPASLLNCSLKQIRTWKFSPTFGGRGFSFRATYGSDAEPRDGGPRASKLVHCYNDKHKGSAGSVRFAIAVSASGRVTRARYDVQDGDIPDEVLECALDRIRGWRFPIEAGQPGADVEFTVVFNQHEDDTAKPRKPAE